MHRPLFNLIVLILVFFSNTFSQDYSKVVLDNPVKIPITLSGSFAEPRTNHFHSGIDIRIGGKIGQRVYSPNDGYVSRIKVQAFGGGKNLYITHNNGYTTVYMHLDSYSPEIDKYVKEYQYKNKVYEFDISLQREDIKIKRGDLIAFAGNSGSSGGPHLHYEIRDTRTQEIINPLFFGLNHIDNNPPIINQIRVLPQGKNYIVNSSNKSNGIRNNDTITIDGDFYLGIYAYDRSKASTLRNGVYDYKLYLDEELFWELKIDKFSFDISRYINACIDYNYYSENGVRFLITKKKPNNRFPYFKTYSNNGIVKFKHNEIYKLRYELKDALGNTTNFVFYAKNSGKTFQEEGRSYAKELHYDRDNNYSYNGISVNVPKNSLYEDSKLYFNVNVDSSYYIYINSPLHNSMKISFPLPEISDKLISKLIIAKKNNKSLTYIGNSKTKTHIYTNTKTYGNMILALDTIAPSVYSLSIDKNNKLKPNAKTIDFKIIDDLSGISSYNGFINGNWVLFEYDGKNHRLYYTIDSNHLNQLENTIEIHLIDRVGNKTQKTYYLSK